MVSELDFYAAFQAPGTTLMPSRQNVSHPATEFPTADVGLPSDVSSVLLRPAEAPLDGRARGFQGRELLPLSLFLIEEPTPFPSSHVTAL